MGVHPLLLRGAQTAGYAEPFPIQQMAIRPLLSGKSVIGQAKTGSGKTAAFGLPMLQSVNTEERDVQGLILAPTRELAVQIATELKKLSSYTKIRILSVYGGQPIGIQLRALGQGVHIVVGTPGRVMDHIRRGSLNLERVKFVVLDEADTMLDMGFIDDIEFILRSVPEGRQMGLFSATMPKRVLDIAGKYMENPERILVSADEPLADHLEQFYTIVEEDAKFGALLELLSRERPSSTIVFCRTKYGARKLARLLERENLNSVPIHGDLSQSQRDHSIGAFRSGRASILVATDVASRGIDVPQVDCVINYDVPQDPLLYFHRVGRTARAGGSGRAFTLVTPRDSQDFARILGLSKVEIKPLSEKDAEHRFYATSSRITDMESSSYTWRRSRPKPRAYQFRHRRY